MSRIYFVLLAIFMGLAFVGCGEADHNVEDVLTSD